ncbi:MAG: hypothetical protein JWN70_5877 [Planctomycetaceae bacterium]|nr:hypothetical protein [Planctomycetaceae bacterium]
MTNAKPRIFIASSVEGLRFAYAIQQNLQHVADCRVWSQGVFVPSSYPLESLEDEFKNSDFGIFVFSPDDTVRIREKRKKTVRDNILIELGISIGQLGRRRSFIVAPRNVKELHIPTDLLGINPVTFELNAEHDNLQAALGPGCTEIGNAILKLSFRTKHVQVEPVDDAPPTTPRVFKIPGREKVRIASPNAIHIKKPDPITRNHPPTSDEIPPAARVLLLAATSGGTKDIALKQGSDDGKLEIHIGTRVIEANDDESKTKWYDGLRALQAFSLIRERGVNKYEVREDGYVAADELRFEDFEHVDELSKLTHAARKLLSATQADPTAQVRLIDELKGTDILVNKTSVCPDGLGGRTAYKNGVFELERMSLIQRASASGGSVSYTLTDVVALVLHSRAVHSLRGRTSRAAHE